MTAVLLLGVLLVLNVAAFLAAHLPALLLVGSIALAAGIWVRRRPARLTEPRVIQGRAEPVEPPEVARLRAELVDARRQVAKLEADAARHDQLVSDLEDAAGRPIEAVIASYRHLQRQYGPATVGKTGETR